MCHGVIYRFSCHDWKLDPVSLSKLRANRILEFGTWLLKQDNSHLITRRYCWISCCVMSVIRSRNLLNASLLGCDTALWQEWFMTVQWEGSAVHEEIFLVCWTLRMKALWSFEMLAATCCMTQCHITEDLNLLQHCFEKLKSCKKCCMYCMMFCNNIFYVSFLKRTIYHQNLCPLVRCESWCLQYIQKFKVDDILFLLKMGFGT
jgi:hypothetical protein